MMPVRIITWPVRATVDLVTTSDAEAIARAERIQAERDAELAAAEAQRQSELAAAEAQRQSELAAAEAFRQAQLLENQIAMADNLGGVRDALEHDEQIPEVPDAVEQNIQPEVAITNNAGTLPQEADLSHLDRDEDNASAAIIADARSQILEAANGIPAAMPEQIDLHAERDEENRTARIIEEARSQVRDEQLSASNVVEDDTIIERAEGATIQQAATDVVTETNTAELLDTTVEAHENTFVPVEVADATSGTSGTNSTTDIAQADVRTIEQLDVTVEANQEMVAPPEQAVEVALNEQPVEQIGETVTAGSTELAAASGSEAVVEQDGPIDLMRVEPREARSVDDILAEMNASPTDLNVGGALPDRTILAAPTVPVFTAPDGRTYASREAYDAARAQQSIVASASNVEPLSPTVAPFNPAVADATLINPGDVTLASLSISSTTTMPPIGGLPSAAPDTQQLANAASQMDESEEIIVTSRAQLQARQILAGAIGNRIDQVQEDGSALIFNVRDASQDDQEYMRSVAAIMLGTPEDEINPAHLERYRAETANSDTTSYSRATLQDDGIFDRYGILGRRHMGTDMYLVDNGELIDTHAELDATMLSPELRTPAPAAVIFAGAARGRDGGGGLSIQLAYERIDPETGRSQTVVDNILHLDMERRRGMITPSTPSAILTHFRETRDDNRFIVIPQGTHIGDIGGSGATFLGGLDADRHRRPHMHLERSIIDMPLADFLALSPGDKTQRMNANLVNPMALLGSDEDVALRPTREDYQSSYNEERAEHPRATRRDIQLAARPDFGWNAQVEGSTLATVPVNFRDEVIYNPDVDGIPTAPRNTQIATLPDITSGAVVTLTGATLNSGMFDQNSITDGGAQTFGFSPGTGVRVVE
jgi:hypothetical protein